MSLLVKENSKQKYNTIIEKGKKHVQIVTPGVYGLCSGGAHSSGTFINLSKSSNMFTANICALSNL